MVGPDLQTVVHRLHRLASEGGAGCAPDAELLGRFVAGRDAASFELLVWRHGAMVLATCRRILGHGPDAETFERASAAELKPQYIADTLAFMFETQLVLRPTRYAIETRVLQHEYFECWQGLKKRFNVT